MPANRPPRFLAAYLPSFALQVAVRATPGLRAPAAGAQLPAPFAVADVDVLPSGTREVPPNADLLAVSAAARRTGVRAGMTVTQARVLCPSIVIRPRDAAAHEAARIAMAEVLSGFGPRVEVAANGDAAWADLTGEAADAEPRIARAAASRLVDAGFVARIAIASDRFTARAVAEYASRVASSRATRRIVAPGGAAACEALRDLPVDALAQVVSAGAGTRTRRAEASIASAARANVGGKPTETMRATARALEIFPRLGIRTLGQIASLPADTLARRFGPDAARYGALARGEDTTPLVPFRIPDALFERIELPAPAATLEPLLFPLKTLLDRAGARLAGRGRAASKLAVHLVLEAWSANPAGHGTAIEIRLPRPTIVTKTILEVARERLASFTLPAPVTEMAVEILDSVPTRRTQLALFDADDRPVDPRRAPPSPERLAVTLGRLATAFGDGAVFAAQLADEHRPEHAFRPSALAQDGASVACESAAAFDAAPRPVRVLRVPEEVRFFPPGDGRPAALFVRGFRRRIVAIAGPERLSGDWWDAPFDRDYWLVRTEEGSLWWIFEERNGGGWRLHGLFD